MWRRKCHNAWYWCTKLVTSLEYLYSAMVIRNLFNQNNVTCHYNRPERKIGPRSGFEIWISMFCTHKFQNVWKILGKIVFLIIKNCIYRNTWVIYATFWTWWPNFLRKFIIFRSFEGFWLPSFLRTGPHGNYFRWSFFRSILLAFVKRRKLLNGKFTLQFGTYHLFSIFNGIISFFFLLFEPFMYVGIPNENLWEEQK